MYAVDDHAIQRRLSFDNAWWALKEDQEIKFKQPPKRLFYENFQLKADSLKDKALLLAGPLRAGKSVMLRQLIANRIENGVSPKDVLYVSLATPSYWAESLEGIFRNFCEKFSHNPNKPLHVFFDEVQYAKNWNEDLSTLVRKHPSVKFVAAASADAPLAAFTGRDVEKDPAPDFEIIVLPPLTFVEFLQIRGSEEKLFSHEDASQPGRRAFHQRYMSQLNEEFVRYVNFGGFPEGIMSRMEGTPPPTFIRDGLIDRVLHKDLASNSGISDIWELNRLFATIAANTACEVSIDELAQVSGIAKNTVRKYLDFLESAFLIRRVTRIDRDAKRFKRIVAFKVYLTTPCLYASLFGPVSLENQMFGRLAETAIFGQWLGSESVGHLAYASWRGGKVDLVGLERRADSKVSLGAPWIVAEMDWEERLILTQEGPKSMGEFIRGNCPSANAYVLTKSIARPGILDGIKVTVMPVSLACYLLQKEMLSRTSRQNADLLPLPIMETAAIMK
ncbi:MAG: AAA family ATPase [Rhodospirillales bacterium]|nr:AAA family ATPase [Rhodospirillales bacterium]